MYYNWKCHFSAFTYKRESLSIERTTGFVFSLKMDKSGKQGGTEIVYGAINEKGEAYYTDLGRVFDSIGNRQAEYNWFITDCVCYPNHPETAAMLSKPYCWISGEDLTRLVRTENFQWIWAVLCGFDKAITLSEILEYSLPYADGYEGFWKIPLTMQHPLAKIEIVPWDSSLTLIFSRSKDIIDAFMAYYPQSENLKDYISRF